MCSNSHFKKLSSEFIDVSVTEKEGVSFHLEDVAEG